MPASKKQRYRQSPKGQQQRQRERRTAKQHWGIDGEGVGRKPHLYVFLAAVNEGGKRRSVYNPAGLSTRECLDFILSLPGSGRLFGYSFTYDLTMMLRDLPTAALYLLFHSELRRKPGKRGLKAVHWKGYRLNLMGKKFTVEFDGKKRELWDIFAFYQSKFTKALEDWKVETDIKRMQLMKGSRSEFDSLSPSEVQEYCYEECFCLAQLSRKLVNAHIEAGLPLKSFHGAGSTASVLLKQMGVGELRDKGPSDMQHAIACAFFGGRFENSIVGPLAQPVHSYDISSAYPYQLTRLPCLIHGAWEFTRSEQVMMRGKHALVQYTLPPPAKREYWAPFPFRTKDGTIVYPQSSGGGWVWRDEWLAGSSLFPRAQFQGAWVLRGDCDCGSPFGRIPAVYRERVRIGKDGPGIVLKLGPNSVYGKLAQSVGTDPPFQCWIWAGMVTSGCRAQILELMAQHRTLKSLLMVATDGVYTLEKLTPPQPENTGTFDLEKPLGGWEHKPVPQGIFAARPGIYWPLNPTEEQLSAVRARGIGRGTVLSHWRTLVRDYRKGLRETSLPGIVRFCGAKTSIHKRTTDTGRVSFNRAETYGDWINREVRLSFTGHPKRLDEQKGGRLLLRDCTGESLPYNRALVSDEAAELLVSSIELEEQPDGDFTLG